MKIKNKDIILQHFPDAITIYICMEEVKKK